MQVETSVLERQDELLRLIDSDDDRLAVLYGGAMGGGKSYGIALAGAMLSIKWPGNRGFIGRNDFKDLRETTYETCIDLWSDLGLIAKHHKSEHWVQFWNGSHVLFGELKDPESRKSLNLGWFGIDEATEVQERAYMMLLSRLRWPNVRYRAILATNPAPGWVKRRFVDEPRQPGHYFIRSLPTDNRELPPGYVESLAANFTDIWIKRYLGGLWDAFEGAVYDEFDRSVHVARAIAPPPEWPRLRAIDHGLRNPTACLWFAVEPVSRIIHVYDEHYLAGQPVSVHAAAILGKSANWPMATVIDPATQQVKDVKNGIGFTTRMEYAQAGISTSLANNARIAGINRVKELLRKRELVIHENCVNLLRELPEYEWKEIDGDQNQPEDAEKKNDHALDALRYGVVALRPLPTTPSKTQVGLNGQPATPRHWSERSVTATSNVRR